MDSKIEKRIIDAIAKQYLPEKFRAATNADQIASRLNEPVAANQLWKVDDRDTIALAFISEVLDDRRLVRVIPIGNYENGFDSRDHVIFPAGSPTGLPLIVYKEFETTIPVRLLSVPYGAFDEHVSEGIRSFEGTYDPYDGDYIALANRMNIRDQFERWQTLCDQLPELHSASEKKFDVRKDIGDYIDALHSVLGLAPAQCLAVRRGTLALTDEQEKRMADADFGTRPQTTNTPPRAFVELSEQPRWRFMVDDYLDHQQSSASLFDLESDARGELAHQAFVLAARTNGSGDDAIIGLLKKAAGSMVRNRKAE